MLIKSHLADNIDTIILCTRISSIRNLSRKTVEKKLARNRRKVNLTVNKSNVKARINPQP